MSEQAPRVLSACEAEALANARLAIEFEEQARREAARIASRRVWAALMLARHGDVLDSILGGRPVLVRQLDPAALRRAFRGGPLPEADSYLRVIDEHLDATAEGGAFA
jgi:hypothetical protein